MCGIIGIFNISGAREKALIGLRAMQERGRDGFGLCDLKTLEQKKHLDDFSQAPKKKNIFGHCLHAIVGYEPQPFLESGCAFIANCEIYNWKALDEEFFLHARNDAHAIFLLLQKKRVEEVLPLLDGPYAFAFWKDEKVIIARDILGEKPAWFSVADGLAFASEKKALLKASVQWVEELNPRYILAYDIKEGKATFVKRKFFERIPEHDDAYLVLLKKLQGLIIAAIAKRIPDQKVGVLFSGGIDSVLIAKVLKDLGADFTCYVAAASGNAEDLLIARKAAREMGFPLTEIMVKEEDIPPQLANLVPLIEDSNVVKVEVGLTMQAALTAAREDGIRVVYSGLGAEELFAGYNRHKKTLASNQDIGMVNEDCLWGLRKLYERDLYRDDCIAMQNNIEMRLPYLDLALVDFSLKIPARYKLHNGMTKAILRDACEALGIPEEFSRRKKVAAQYGSGFDKALQRLARQGKHRTRSSYLRTFYPHPNLRLACLFSSGKDSHLALHLLREHNYEIPCLITMKSANPDSYMFHTPTIELARLQSTALNIPLVEEATAGEKEAELEDLKRALIRARTAHHIEGIVTGAIGSNYQRERIERIADALGLKVFSPLWHLSQETELAELLRCGFTFVMAAVAAEGLDETWLAKPIDETDVGRLLELHKKNGLNVAGEGGEYESLVLHGPGYAKRIVIDDYSVEKDGIAARMVVKKAHLE